jgi:hypothetical protein
VDLGGFREPTSEDEPQMAVIHRNFHRNRQFAFLMESCEARILMASGPSLGAAASFAVLGGTTVTSTGATAIVGNVGVSPGTSITGFGPGTISGGEQHANDTLAMQAEADLATAYGDLAAEPVDTILSGQDLGGQTLTPGVYKFASSAQMNGTLTLDAQGNSQAVFVFQIGTTLTTGTNSAINLIGGARSRNIYWQVGTSATIGTDTTFQGNILADTSITLDTGANISPGRALAITGAVTMDTNALSNVFTTPLTITANDQTKVYGAALPTLTASYSGFIDGDTSASLTTLPSLTSTATNASPVGSYTVTAAGAVDPDYIISYVNGPLDVTPAPLTITADDQTKVYGAALPTLTASYTTLVNNDTPSSLATPPTIATLATAASPIGSYTITVSGAVDPNYTISYANGTLVVTPVTISGTVYLDENASGTLDAGEPGLAGRVVFVDLNNDGTLDIGDPTATTDAQGNFTLVNSSMTTGPVLEATDQDTRSRYVVDQTVTNGDGSVDIGVVPISPIAPVPVIPDAFSMTPSGDADTAYVQSLYKAVLGRVGGSNEVDTWLVRMNSGMTTREVAGDFVNSPEHRQDQVRAYYEDFLHRAPDPTSAFWVNALESGVSEETIAEAFLDSPEYQSAHPDSTSFVANLYIDVLGRQGDPQGLANWQTALTSGVSRQDIVADFVESFEADDQIVTSDYAAFLHRPREANTSNVWISMLQAPNGSASDVAADILASPEFDQDAVKVQA